MLVDIILFIFGFICLIKGADFLVEGASSIAKKYNISNLVIGLTIVAFGTSMPELIVSSFASVQGSIGVAMGNIIGSNISNTLLILGVSAIIYPLLVKRSTVNKEIPLSLLVVVAVWVMVNDKIIDGNITNALSRIDGLILILFFVIFIYYTFSIKKNQSGILEKIGDEKIKQYKFLTAVGLIFIGLVGLFVGGKWIVDGAILFAKYFGISETLIGLTIVAVGTSLPELAASGMAAYKKKTDIAVGAVVGSNIFNLLWVLGISAIIRPMPFDASLNYDFLFLFVITILALFLIFIGKKNVIGRKEGWTLVSLYIIYIIFLIFRG